MRPFYLTEDEVRLIQRLRTADPTHQEMVRRLSYRLADKVRRTASPTPLHLVPRASAAK